MQPIKKGNLYDGAEAAATKFEQFDEILESGDFLIERIISSGQFTPEGKWLMQDRDEWVVLLEGNASISFRNNDPVEMVSGDHIFIPARTEHRVERTSIDPKCLWLAVHGKFIDENENS